MSRFDELREQLAFEKAHPHASRRSFALLRKLARVLPDSIAFALFNFGSSFARASSFTEPVAQAPAPVPLLHIDEFPPRGLPYSDAVVQEVAFSGYEFADDPIFAMRELHRVCSAGARVTLSLRGTWSDPLQKRVATRDLLAPFFDNSARARELRIDGLFRLVADEPFTLEVLRATSHRTRNASTSAAARTNAPVSPASTSCRYPVSRSCATSIVTACRSATTRSWPSTQRIFSSTCAISCS